MVVDHVRCRQLGVAGVAVGCGAVVVRPPQRHVKQPESHHDDGGKDGEPVLEPRQFRVSGPGDVGDTNQAPQQGEDVHPDTPTPQREGARWLPAFEPCSQGSQDDHLESEVNAQGGKGDNRYKCVLRNDRPDDDDGRNGSCHEQGERRYIEPVVPVAEEAVAREHLVATHGVDEARSCGLQAHDAGDEGDEDDGQHQFVAQGAEGAQQGRPDGVDVRTVDDGRDVGDGEDQGQAHKGGGEAADIDSQAHGFGDAASWIGDFFSDITAGFEPVVLKNAQESGGGESEEVVVALASSEGVEEDGKVILAGEHQEQDAYDEGSAELGNEPDHGDSAKGLGPGQVDAGRDGQDDESTDDSSCDTGLKAQERTEEGPGTVGDCGDGREQGDGVDPPVHPCPLLAPKAPGPGIDASGNGVVGDDFAENQGDEELACSDDEQGPQHWRSASSHGSGEEGVNAYNWGEVGEAQRDVAPEAHLPLELLVVGVSQRCKARCVRVVGVIHEVGIGVLAR